MRLRRLKNRLNPYLLLTLGLAFALILLAYFQFSRPVPEVLIAKQDLALGTSISIDDFQVAELDLGPSQSAYIPSDEFPSGGVLARTISAGEVLARSQITEFAPAGFTVLRLKPELPIADSLKIGDRVSVWVVQGQQFEELAPAEEVSWGRLIAVETSEGLFADELAYVEVSIPEITLPTVLKSIAASDKVYLVEPGP